MNERSYLFSQHTYDCAALATSCKNFYLPALGSHFYETKKDRSIMLRSFCHPQCGGRVRAPNENLYVSAAALHTAGDTYTL